MASSSSLPFNSKKYCSDLSLRNIPKTINSALNEIDTNLARKKISPTELRQSGCVENLIELLNKSDNPATKRQALFILRSYFDYVWNAKKSVHRPEINFPAPKIYTSPVSVSVSVPVSAPKPVLLPVISEEEKKRLWKIASNPLVNPDLETHLPDVLAHLTSTFTPDCDWLTDQGRMCGQGRTSSGKKPTSNNFNEQNEEGFYYYREDDEKLIRSKEDEHQSVVNSLPPPTSCLSSCRNNQCANWLHEIMFNTPKYVEFIAETRRGNETDISWEIKKINLTIDPGDWQYSSDGKYSDTQIEELISRGCSILQGETDVPIRIQAVIELTNPADTFKHLQESTVSAEFSEFKQQRGDILDYYNPQSYFVPVTKNWEFSDPSKFPKTAVTLTTEIVLPPTIKKMKRPLFDSENEDEDDEKVSGSQTKRSRQ